MSRCRCRRRVLVWSGSGCWSAVVVLRCSRSRRPGRCIGRGRSSLSGVGPGSLRPFAPSQTRAARTPLGTRRFKTDDRDCAALLWLARQGAGQPARSSAVDALRAAVSHRRQLVLALKPLRQRLHDQLNALAPGLSAPEGHGRAVSLHSSTGRAVLACAVDLAGRPPTVRSLKARADGRLSDVTARSGRRAGRTAEGVRRGAHHAPLALRRLQPSIPRGRHRRRRTPHRTCDLARVSPASTRATISRFARGPNRHLPSVMSGPPVEDL